MPVHLIRKLDNFVRLTDEEKSAIEIVASARKRLVGPHIDLAREGDDPSFVHVILSGWACRYKQLSDGRRQIVGIFVPGDICNSDLHVLPPMDHSIGTLSQVSLAEISRDAFNAFLRTHPRITQACQWDALVSVAVQREWTVDLGQRSAMERMCHLFCELFLRLRIVGLTDGDACAWPITQVDLAEAMGMSSVHVNRTLQEMRATGLVNLRNRRLAVPDLDALMTKGLFNAGYLHLGGPAQRGI